MVAGYWNYDASDFERQSPLSEDESKMEQVFNAQHDVHDLIAPDKFKSYEELQQKLNDVLGEGPTQQERTVERQVETQEAKSDFDDYFKADDKPTSEGSTSSASNDDDEDLESYFKSLAAD